MDRDRRPRRVAGALAAVSLIAAMSYMSLAALHGEYGLFRLFTIEAEEARLQSVLADQQAELTVITTRNNQLAQQNEPELVDEQARRVLGLSRADEFLPR